MAKKTRRVIVAVRGDTHAGHAGGLLNPETLLPERDLGENGQTVIAGWRRAELRPVQGRLWQWHEQDREKIRELAGKDEIILLDMGDMTQGVKYSDDLGMAAISDQVFAAQWGFAPWLDMPNVRAAFLVNGTGSHTLGGTTETMLTMLLKGQHPKTRIEIVEHWLLSVGGYTIDVAHHGPGPGIRAWTRGNVWELYLRSILLDELALGHELPDMALRGHMHALTYGRAIHQAGGQVWELPGWITAPYCFIGQYAQQVGRSPGGMMVGMLAFEIVDGRLIGTHPFSHVIDLRVTEAV